jgi:hypothetical protein
LIKFRKYIKTNFVLGEEVEVLNGSKFYLLKMKEWHGTEIPGAYGKLF